MVNGTGVTPLSRPMGRCPAGLPRLVNHIPTSYGWDFRTQGSGEPNGSTDAPIALSMSWNCLTSGLKSPVEGEK